MSVYTQLLETQASYIQDQVQLRSDVVVFLAKQGPRVVVVEAKSKQGWNLDHAVHGSQSSTSALKPHTSLLTRRQSARRVQLARPYLAM